MRAKLQLGSVAPRVEIGAAVVDTAVAARSLRELHIHPGEIAALELPVFLKKALAS